MKVIRALEPVDVIHINGYPRETSNVKTRCLIDFNIDPRNQINIYILRMTPRKAILQKVVGGT